MFFKKRNGAPSEPPTETADAAPTSEAQTAEHARAVRSLGFFKNPQALSPTHHQALRLNRNPADLSFARATRLVPITTREFERAALDYPIVLAGDVNRPCVVMGLRDGQNLFIGEDGAIEAGKYVPMLLRQHPFFLSHIPGVREPILMIDRDAPSLSETSGAPLFADTTPSQTTLDTLALLRAIQVELAETEQFVAELHNQGLIEPAKLRLTEREGGAKLDLASFNTVRAAGATKLPADAQQRFAARGYERLIHAVTLSQQNWTRVFDRLMAKNTGEAA